MSDEKQVPEADRRAISLEIAEMERDYGRVRAAAVIGVAPETLRKALPKEGVPGQIGAILARKVVAQRGGSIDALKKKHGIGHEVSETELVALAVRLLEIRGAPVAPSTVDLFRARSYSGGPRTVEAIADELRGMESDGPPKASSLTKRIATKQRRKGK